MQKPGYKTTEHALTWAVVLLGAITLCHSINTLDHLAALLAPAIASAAYSHARGRVKSPTPFDLRQLFREQLSELFRGRIVK